MRKTYIYIFLSLFSIGALAQRQAAPSRKVAKKDKTDAPETYEVKGYGITTNTHSGVIGGFIYRNSKSIGSWRGHQMNRYFAIEAVNIKHPKEKSISLDNLGAARVILDKENYLVSIRPQYGREVVLFKKYGEEGIGITAIIAGGPSIGIEKPYYIKYQTGSGQNAAQETVAFDPNIHDLSRIVGSGSALQGIGYSKIIPGLNLKLGLNLDVNTFGNSLTGFEIGFLAEWFTRKPTIIGAANIDPNLLNEQFFTSGYLTLYFGSKKNK